MDIAAIVFEKLEMITGLPVEELREIMDLNLQENEILDSLSIAELLSAIGSALGKPLDFGKFKVEDFSTIRNLIAAVETHNA